MHGAKLEGGSERQAEAATATLGKAYRIPGLELEMIQVPAGEFLMGSPSSEEGRGDYETQHKVSITRPYWMGKTEVTQGQWSALMGTGLRDQAEKSNEYELLLIGGEDNDYPIYYVSWEEAMEFCRKLTDLEDNSGRLPKGYQYTLPTEAEWEYACLSGTSSALYTGTLVIKGKANGPALDPIAWYVEN